VQNEAYHFGWLSKQKDKLKSLKKILYSFHIKINFCEMGITTVLVSFQDAQHTVKLSNTLPTLTSYLLQIFK